MTTVQNWSFDHEADLAQRLMLLNLHIPDKQVCYFLKHCNSKSLFSAALQIVRNFFKSHYLFKSYFTESYLNYFQMVAGVVNWNSISIWLLLFVDISQLFFYFGLLNYFSSAYFELTLLTCPVCVFFTHF